MKKFLFPYLAIATSLLSLPAFSQSKDKDKAKTDTTNKLGLPGDGLDLYAVLEIFQKSKTIEAFEKSLNDKETKVNNLDLNLDKKVDFIKVVTKSSEKESYAFILRVDVSKTESQDVAVILLDRDKDKKVSLQIVGDEEIYGKDYVIEPKGNSSVTPNPGYTGDNPVTVTVPATTNVVVQQAPIVQYVYSPAYVPYYPPYYYGYYPGWYAFHAVVSFGFYAAAWGGYHGHYHGGHYHGGNNVIINNNNNFNNFNNNKMRSNTVSDNRAKGNYGNGKLDHGRGGGNSSVNRPSTSDRQGVGRNNASTRPSTSDRQGGGLNNASTRPSTSDRSGGGLNNASTRPSTSQNTRPSTSNRSSSNYSSRSGSYGGGGRSMGGGFSGGGRSYGGGGGGRRR